MSSEYLTLEQREEILNTAVVLGGFVLASGQRAKQKFDFDLIEDNSDIFRSVVSGLASCIEDNFSNYSSILTIAKGATRLGEPLATKLRTKHINSEYFADENGIKQFSITPEEGIDRVVIVDDVFTHGTNATKVALAAKEHNIETVGLAVVLDRSGIDTPMILSQIAVASIIKQKLD